MPHARDMRCPDTLSERDELSRTEITQSTVHSPQSTVHSPQSTVHQPPRVPVPKAAAVAIPSTQRSPLHVGAAKYADQHPPILMSISAVTVLISWCHQLTAIREDPYNVLELTARESG